MITKDEILGGLEFNIHRVDTSDSYQYTVVKCDDDTLRVYGAKAGGKLRYIGVLFPTSGHLLTTSKTLKDRHIKVSKVFRWVISTIWESNTFPENYNIMKLDCVQC